MKKHHVRWLAPVFAASLLFAGCSDDDGDEDTSDTTAAESTDTTAASDDTTDTTAATSDSIAAADPGTVQVAEVGDLGPILVDADGMTLYRFTSDAQGTSNCNDACAEGWPPYEAEEAVAGEGVTGEVAVITRNDGTTQVTINGWPLYTFGADAAPGEANGQGTGGSWFVVGADGNTIE